MLAEIRRFGENEIKPIAGVFDQAEKSSKIGDKVDEMGLLRSSFPREYGSAEYSIWGESC